MDYSSIFSIIASNSPKAGDEWKPDAFPGKHAPSDELKREAEEVTKRIYRESRRYKRDEDVKRARHVIEDPLAIYVPYHSSMGIYFRVNRMISDFCNLYTTYGYVMKVSAEVAWHVYVMLIFWHELAHHVIEDVATVLEGWGLGKYPLVPNVDEERFCEFNAFSTTEKRLASPTRALLPLTFLWVSRIGIGHVARRSILSCIYYHWGRHQPSSSRRPRVEPSIPKAVDGLWNGFWEAHLAGRNVLRVPTEIYNRVFVTTL